SHDFLPHSLARLPASHDFDRTSIARTHRRAVRASRTTYNRSLVSRFMFWPPDVSVASLLFSNGHRHQRTIRSATPFHDDQRGGAVPEVFGDVVQSPRQRVRGGYPDQLIVTKEARMRERLGFLLFTVGLVALWPSAARAQSAIAGVVKDTSGAVLPGVTVEAASDALIEKTRSVTTDGDGQYKIVDLRPGTYSVTFTLVGFATVKRDGIELPANFTSTINADL